MNITLQNVRSLRDAALNGTGILMVLGINTSGKTSLMNAVAAAFLGDAKIYGATKADASHVVRKGEANASVRVSSGVQENGEDSPETWGRGLVWPFEGDIIEHGVAPPADEITMGRVDPAHDFDKKQWADFIRTICGPDAKVGWATVEKALTTGEYGTTQWGLEVKEALRTAGWDSTATMCANKAKDAKRAWEKATGERFGTDKANGWMHPALARQTADQDDGASLKDLQDTAEGLSADLARAKAAGEIQNQSKEDLEAEIAGYRPQITDLQTQIEAIAKERDQVDDELAKFPRTKPMQCPHCSKSVDLVGTKLEPSKHYDEAKAAKLVKRADGLSNDLSDRKCELGQYQAKLEAAESMLGKLGPAQMARGNAQAIEEELLDISTRLDAQRVTSAAGEAFSAWAFWNHAAAVVGPLGVRYEATKTAVAKLQPKLDEIAKKIFPEHKVEIHANEDGLDLTFDGFDYRSMVWNGDPNSYKLGIQVMFQILHAEQLGPEAPILIDRADTLDKRRLGGVLNCLVQRKRVAIVAKTVAERPETDLLANAKVGKTYYINNGTVEAV